MIDYNFFGEDVKALRVFLVLYSMSKIIENDKNIVDASDKKKLVKISSVPLKEIDLILIRLETGYGVIKKEPGEGIYSIPFSINIKEVDLIGGVTLDIAEYMTLRKHFSIEIINKALRDVLDAQKIYLMTKDNFLCVYDKCRRYSELAK